MKERSLVPQGHEGEDIDDAKKISTDDNHNDFLDAEIGFYADRKDEVISPDEDPNPL